MKKDSQSLTQQLRHATYLTKSIGKQELRKKISRLRHELNSLSDKIGKSHDEETAVSYQKEYEVKHRQFNFFKDIKRRYQSVPLQDQRYEQKIQSPAKPQKLYLSNRRYRQDLLFNDECSLQLPNESSQRIMNIRRNLEQKFVYYCKNKTKIPPYFSDVMPESNMMSYKGFLLFNKHAGLEEVLTFEERLRIFNKCSKFKKRLLLNEFMSFLQECCRLICQKHQAKFTKHSYNVFLANILVKLEISFIVPQNHSIKKLQIHTGLFKESMIKILEDSRKSLDQKRVRSFLQRKKTLSRIKLSFPIPNRSASQQSESSSKIILQYRYQRENNSIQKNIEPRFVSYTSIMKNHQDYDRKKEQNPKLLQLSNPKRGQNKISASKMEQYKPISDIVDMQQPDSILEQMLSRNY